jgi:uncharacterized membrane protein HdeD (DUF308 family)
MSNSNQQATASTETALALRNLYLTRAAFSITWVILIALFSKSSATAAAILLTIYPLWDLTATYFDIRANKNAPSKTPQLVNMAISLITAIAVVFALQRGVPQALIVFGIWAILTGLTQLVLALRRRQLGGQWPLIISGGQSMIGGTSFILLANDPTMGITSLAGYAGFGAFYFLLSAWRLSKVNGTPVVNTSAA